MIAQLKRPGLGYSPARDPTPELLAALHSCRTAFVGTGLFSGVINILMLTGALFVEAKVSPNDIDQLQIDQEAGLRFSAFNQRMTPEINGTVSRVAADITVDQRTGQSYYTVDIVIGGQEVARLGELKLVPGMPVEAFIKTHDRRVISYLAKPLSDQIARAFREQ